MDVSVPPIVRGEFLYRDVLLVDVGGELKRHARAPESEIKQALNARTGQKDKTAHWYEAQLIHYGLQRSKEKNTAKLRLHEALNQKKLKAPPQHLVDMEGAMKRDYAAAIRKAKTQLTPSGREKRAREDDVEQSAKKTKISVRVGDVSIDIDQAGTSSTKKSTPGKAQVIDSKKKAPKATGEKKAKASTPKPKNSANLTQIGNTRDHSAGAMPPFYQDMGDLSEAKAKTPKKQPVKTSTKREATKSETTKKGAVKKEPKVKNEPIVRPEATVKPEPKVKSEPKVKPEPRYDFNQSQEQCMEEQPGFDESQSQKYVTGVYNISCPVLAEEVRYHADKFRLFVCVDKEGNCIWSGFDLAWKSGVIKIDSTAWGVPLSFGWRAKDYEASGKGLRFGKGCFGDIEFYGEQQVRGVFYNLFSEPVQFDGKRRAGPLWCGKAAWKFEQEWDDFPRQAYGR